MSQSPQAPATVPQLKLAVVQDGNVFLQQHNAFGNTQRVQHYVQSTQVQGRAVNNTVGSVILPITTSTATVPVVTSEPSSSRNHSTLIARLNAAPAISVPDVSSLALVSSIVTTSVTTTTVTTTTTTLVPFTIQSLTFSNSPNTSTGYVMQRTNTVPVTSERVFFSDDVGSTQNIATVISTSASSVQPRVNHINSGFQTMVVTCESSTRTVMQSAPKIVQSTLIAHASTTNSVNIVQAELEKSGHTEIADSSGAPVPSHNLPALSNSVPNQVSNHHFCINFTIENITLLQSLYNSLACKLFKLES